LFDRLARRGGPAYPHPRRRGLERLYNRLFGFTIAWAGYFLAVLLLLASLATRRRRGLFRPAGMAVFLLSTLFLLAGVVVRWIISGRGWHLPPLTNQYESVLGAAAMAAVAGCVLELIFRRGMLALAGSLFAAAALLCLFLRLGPLQGDINAPEALLNTPILAWHVAVLMVGYGVIGMSLVVSAAYLLLAPGRARRARLASQAISAGADLSLPAAQEGNILAELDRYNLILLQLACWMVAVGDALGAYWADRAWGRWWGWDPKETWGLMTLLVYLGIIHVRHVLPQRRRGVWTAGLAILGCAVMGFTWWGVNYLLRGLHSYA
jgi:ABC-type transport system involved in cytochrome c biogenesis permease subunit